MQAVHMPQLTLGHEAVTVIAWHKQPGDEVRQGEPIMEIETEKASMDVEAPLSGTLLAHLCAPGDAIRSGDAIAIVGEPGEEVNAAATESKAPAPTVEGVTSQLDMVRSEPAEIELSSARAALSTPPMPAIVEHGELRGLPWPSRPDAIVPTTETRSQIIAAPPTPRVEPLSKHRRAIARRLTAAASIPQFATTRELRVDSVIAQVKEARNAGIAATITDGLVIALAIAAARVPQANAWLVDDALQVFDSVCVGIAIDTPSGVVAPVIRDVRPLHLTDIAARRAELVTKARAGELAAADLEGATITISNVGGLGADSVTPLVTPPQVSVLGVGRTRLADGHTVATFTFVGDHRAIDGADGARLLAALAAALEPSSEA